MLKGTFADFVWADTRAQLRKSPKEIARNTKQKICSKHLMMTVRDLTLGDKAEVLGFMFDALFRLI